MGFIPLVLWLFGFSFLLTTVCYSSLNKAKTQIAEALTDASETGKYLLDLTNKIISQAGFPNLSNADKAVVTSLNSYFSKTTSEDLISSKYGLQQAEALSLVVKHLSDDGYNLDNEDVQNGYRSYRMLQITGKNYYTATRSYNAFVNGKPSSYVAFLFGFKPLVFSVKATPIIA